MKIQKKKMGSGVGLGGGVVRVDVKIQKKIFLCFFWRGGGGRG